MSLLRARFNERLLVVSGVSCGHAPYRLIAFEQRLFDDSENFILRH
jgi:hypothetical protein